MSGPSLLDDLLVVDLSRNLPGPLVSRLLGDLGARVIKVEEPTLGDPSRHMPGGKGGTSSLSAMLLAGHQSLALNLKKDTARECLEEMLITADVLVESFRPGTLERFGLSPTALRQRYPRLIICSVSGWGQDGPDAQRAGHDLTYQAIGGSLAGGRGMPAAQTADIVGAWSATTSVLAALHRRHRDGQGCWIDSALLDAAGHASVMAWAAETESPRADGEPLLLTGAVPCYNLYPTKDGGRLALAALEPRFWKRFCAAVGRRDWLLRQYETDGAVHREVAELVAGRTREEWVGLFAEHDIPADPVLSAAEARAHPQVKVRDLIREGDDGLPQLGFPARFDGERPRVDASTPGLGEHTGKVAREFGLAPELSARQRRVGGIGRRFSFKRWVMALAGRAAPRGLGKRSVKEDES